MQKISLREKIGQMLLIGFDGMEVLANSPVVLQMEEFGIGGVILFDYNFATKQFVKNIANKEQVQKLNSALQYFNTKANKNKNRPDVPLLISVDYEGGFVNRLKESYGFPKTYAASLVGKMSDKEIEQVAKEMADTLLAAGFNLNFAPVLDVDINPDNPILGKLGRCFSKVPEEVARVAEIYERVFIENNIRPSFKHFPGHGSSKADSHLGFVDVTDSWEKQELTPYQLLFKKGLTDKTMVMTAHIINRELDDSGLPATLSYKILTEMLRQELHFNGVIISDDMQMKAISEQYSLEDSLPLAINAGVDMFIFGNQLTETPEDFAKVIDIIENNVKNGLIKQERIDESYNRILAFKSGM